MIAYSYDYNLYNKLKVKLLLFYIWEIHSYLWYDFIDNVIYYDNNMSEFLDIEKIKNTMKNYINI